MKAVLLATAAALTLASAASADPVLTFRYDNLAGTYNSGAGTFEAHAVNTASLQTNGNFTRIVAPTGSAQFQAGFVSDPGPADFTLNLSVAFVGTDIFSAGTFSATDADGDRVTGNINGTWLIIGGQSIFNGLLTNVTLHADADGLFEGTNGGSWDLAALAGITYEGAVIQLAATSNLTPGGGFSNAVTNSLGQILVPLPSAAMTGLGMLGILFAARRIYTARNR